MSGTELPPAPPPGTGPATAGEIGALTERPRSVLEEEREFFLRSLRDLEAEHDAGDIDDTDYRALKDDYTVRAAAVLRQLDAGADSPAPDASGSTAADTLGDPDPASEEASEEASEPAQRRRRRLRRPRRRWLALAVVALSAGGLAGWAVSAASGTRLPGETVSGNAVGAEQTEQTLLAAQKAAGRGDAVTALKDCRTVLATDPNQPQALAEEGWVLAQTQQSDLQSQGLADLNRALSLDPTDSTTHLYRGIVDLDLGRDVAAVPDLRWYLAHQPDPSVRPKVEAALARALTPGGG